MMIATAAMTTTAIITLKPVFLVKGMDDEGEEVAVDELVFSIVLSVAEPLLFSDVLEAEAVFVVEVDSVVDADVDAVESDVAVDCSSVAVFSIPSSPMIVFAVPPSAANVPSPVSQLHSPEAAFDPQQNLLPPQDTKESSSPESFVRISYGFVVFSHLRT